MVKRKTDGPSAEEEDECSLYSGPFSAELIVIIARYLSAKDTLTWALCSKNMSNLLLCEDSLWKLYIQSDWGNICAPRMETLLEEAGGSYFKLYRRIQLSRTSVHTSDNKERPFRSMVQQYTEWSERGYPSGKYLAKLTYKTPMYYYDRTSKSRLVVEAIDYVTNTTIRTWDLTQEMEKGNLWYDATSANSFMCNNRFISIKMMPTPGGVLAAEEDDSAEDVARIWILDVETGSGPITIELDENGDQSLTLRNTYVWTIGYWPTEVEEEPIDPETLLVRPVFAHMAFYVKAYSAIDGKIEFHIPIPRDPTKPYHGAGFDPRTSIDDTHLIYFDGAFIVLVEIKTKMQVAKLAMLASCNPLFAPDKACLLLMSDMVIAHNGEDLAVWRRPYHVQIEEIRPSYRRNFKPPEGSAPPKPPGWFPLFPFNFHQQIKWVLSNGPQSIVMCIAKRGIYSVTGIFSTNPIQTIISADQEQGVNTAQMGTRNLYFSDKRTLVVLSTNNLTLEGWDLVGCRKVLDWPIETIIPLPTHKDTGLVMQRKYVFMEGPYLAVALQEGLHVWDLSGQVVGRRLRSTTTAKPALKKRKND